MDTSRIQLHHLPSVVQTVDLITFLRENQKDTVDTVGTETFTPKIQFAHIRQNVKVYFRSFDLFQSSLDNKKLLLDVTLSVSNSRAFQPSRSS